MTLLETMLAVFLSSLMVLPLLGWGTLTMQQQAEVAQRTNTSNSFGLIRTAFLRDVTTALEATTEGDALRRCRAGVKGERPLLALANENSVLSYSLLPASTGSWDLERLECGPSGGTAEDRLVLLADTVAGGVAFRCDTDAALDAADAALGAKDRLTDRGAPLDGDRTACRRLTLRVGLGADARSMSAQVRAGSSTGPAPVDPPVAVADAEPVSGMRPLKVQLVGKGSYDPTGGELKYSWDLGDGRTSDEVNPVVVYTRAGSLTAILTVTSDRGLSASASVVVEVGDNPPVAVIAAPASEIKTTRGTAVQFSSKGSGDPLDEEFGGRVEAYLWDFGDGTTSSEANPTKRYERLSPPEGFVVRLGVMDDGGQVATAEVRVHVTNRTPTVSITASPTSGTAPLQVRFGATVTDEPDMARPPALRYAWDFGNGTTSTEAAPTHTYATAGTWTVRLTVTDDQGATATTSTTVTSSSASVAPAAPTGLRQTRSGLSGSSHFIDFAWDATRLAVTYQVTVTCGGCRPISGTVSQTAVRLSGANPSITYLVSVRARSADGTWGPWSAEIKARV